MKKKRDRIEGSLQPSHVTEEAINQVRHMRQRQAAASLNVTRVCLQKRCEAFGMGGWPTKLGNFAQRRKVAEDEGESESDAEDDDGGGSVCRGRGAVGTMKEILPTDVRKTLRQAMAFSISPAAVKLQFLQNGWKEMRSPRGRHIITRKSCRRHNGNPQGWRQA